MLPSLETLNVCITISYPVLYIVNDIRIQHGLSIDDTVDEWVAFMENQQSPEVTEDAVYKFESKVQSYKLTSGYGMNFVLH